MTGVDSRVVTIKFDNAAFNSKVASTLGVLDKLKSALSFSGQKNGLANVQTSAKNFNLSSVGASVDGISAKFLALSTVGITTLATITTAALRAGGQVAKSLSISPALEGFREYETNMNSIQTILANTGLEGPKGLAKVNSALQNLNTYSDKTIYNFSEMAKNIGTFTSAGVDLNTATISIKGIANLAAISGSNSEQASSAMYQLSQAIAANKVGQIDWISAVNSGIGGKVFQSALYNTALAMGKLSTVPVGTSFDKWTKAGGNFKKDILSKGVIDGKVLTNTLKGFSGELTVAQLKSIGYTASQIKQVQKMGALGIESATKVKTLTQLVGTLKEAAGSGWTQTFAVVFGDFNEAKGLFTGISNFFGGMISSSAQARNAVLTDWKKMGGRTLLLTSISAAFKNIMAIIKPIREAFREFFPKKTAADLYASTKAFKKFADALKPSAATVDNLKRTFRGLFAAMDIVKTVVGIVIDSLSKLFKSAGGGGGGFLSLTAKIGDAVVAFDKMLKKGQFVEKFFSGIADRLAAANTALHNVASAIGRLFDKFDINTSDKVTNSLSGFERVVQPLKTAANAVKNFVSNVGRVLGQLGSKVGQALGGFGSAIAGAITPQTFSQALGVINTALLGGILLMIKKFFAGGVKVDVGGGIFDKITTTLGAVTDTLKTMQASVRANIILKIAGALALLTASIFILSTIKTEDLIKAMVSIAVGFVILNAAMVKLTKGLGFGAALKLPLITAGLIGLATAVVIMAAALKIMASIKPEDSGRALLTLGLTLLILQKAMKPLAANSSGMIRAAAALTILGIALNIIAIALKIFATFKYAEMARGLTAMAGSLAVIIIAMRLLPKGMVLQAVALTILATALAGIGLALKIFATFSPEQTGKALLALSGSLLVIVGAINLLPKSMLLQAVALVAVAEALVILAGALKIMATMGWMEIARGLTVLAGSLLIIAIAMKVMTFALPGAAALLVVAGALAVLTPILVTLGLMSWDMIIKGLSTLAGVFVIIGLAGLVLTPVVPTIFALAAALVLLGAGLALAGVGSLAVASAFAIVVAAGAAGITVLAGILQTFISSLPAAFAAFAAGIVKFAQGIAVGGPAFFRAFSAILSSMLNAIIVNVPKIGAAFLKIVNTALVVLVRSVPAIARAGLALLLGLLNALNANIGRIVGVVGSLIGRFVNALSDQIPRVIASGVRFILKFINSLTAAIDANAEELGRAGGRLAVAIVRGMVNGIGAGIGEVGNAARDLAKSALSSVTGFLGIHSPSREFHKVGTYVTQGLVNGLTGGRSDVDKAFAYLKTNLSTAMQAATQDVAQAERKLSRLTNARHRDNVAIRQASAALAQAKKEQRATTSAFGILTKSFGDEHKRLDTLGTAYDKITKKLDAANKVLADAKKTRDDYAVSVKDQYSTLPDITEATHVGDFITTLQKQIADTKLLAGYLQKLKKLGLNDAVYKELLAKGPAALTFAQDLVAGGKASVNRVNSVSSQLNSQAKALGNSASTALYGAAVQSAQGLVNGLKSQQTKIDKQMNVIAQSMVKAIKKALGIKSPSRKFFEIGKYSSQGMADGLSAYSGLVDKSAGKLGDNALTSLKSSMSRVSNAVSGNLDFAPVIAPVIDLTDFRKGASRMTGLLATAPIQASVSLNQATGIALARQAAQEPSVANAAQAAPSIVKFEQTITSPVALSTSEIYRQTHNQLSQAKTALGLVG